MPPKQELSPGQVQEIQAPESAVRKQSKEALWHWVHGTLHGAASLLRSNNRMRPHPSLPLFLFPVLPLPSKEEEEPDPTLRSNAQNLLPFGETNVVAAEPQERR
ncbi:MAG: hypothetical protein AB2556_25305 [Candidatus Thiodiazotropha sp.]